MNLVKDKANSQLESMLMELKHEGMMDFNRALEVACGNCHVTRDVLVRYFSKIDLMDRSPEAIRQAEQLAKMHQQVGDTTQTTMEAFKPKKRYNCPVLRYCIGYLSDRAAVTFLKKLRANLEKCKAYILVQDHVLPKNHGEDSITAYGQRVRKESDLQNIFK